MSYKLGSPQGLESLEEDVAWRAVQQRDRRFDGKFVYAAVTTGIYCRPSCPARHPRRRNVLLFPTAAEAERKGYIECRRCNPATESLTVAESAVQAVIDYIELHFSRAITLDRLSLISGFHPTHLHHTFKTLVGLSPKSFCDARRFADFRRRLRSGDSISHAAYAVGYGSSRALYEKATKRLGMTPKEYQRGGDGIAIRCAIRNTPFGEALMAATERGLCAVLLEDGGSLLLNRMREEFPKAALILEPCSDEWSAILHACQEESALLAQLPFPTRSCIFQDRVWTLFMSNCALSLKSPRRAGDD